MPLLPSAGPAHGVSIVFEDVSRYVALQRELEGNRRDLELAYEELQSTIEELETTNEELQSANEELQTTNEELQSTNEELETMNEELQSTNEELETINDELRDRTAELNQVNEFLEAILRRSGSASWSSTASSACRSGTTAPRICGAVRPDEAVDHHLCRWTSGCRSSGSPARCAPCWAGAATASRRCSKRSTAAAARSSAPRRSCRC